MTWALPFLFIHFVVQSGIPAERAGVALRLLLTFFLGCLVLLLIQAVARRYLPSSHRTRAMPTYRGGS